MKNSKLNPYFITGFSDWESSFSVSIYKDKDYKTGWRVNPGFSIGLHCKDFALLSEIQAQAPFLYR
jgi:hypothetical protein